MDTISKLLENKSFNEPPEIKIIKKFVKDNFDDDCMVNISKFRITIIVGNSALAGAIKEKLQTLKNQLTTEKEISIRIRGV